VKSIAEKIALLPPYERKRALDEIAPTERDKFALQYNWKFWGRPEQQEPPGDWFIWLILSGRGWGKTRTGAEWILHRVRQGARRIFLVGRTAADVRDTILFGESGIMSIAPPWEYPKWEPTKRLLTWPNGATALCFSADKPDQMRGPQGDTAWVDELAAWRYEDAWHQLRLAIRSAQSGLRPRILATTTPRPTELIRKLNAQFNAGDKSVYITRGNTIDNRSNMAPEYIEEMYRIYGGTRLGRQELNGEILEDNPGAIFSANDIEEARIPRSQVPPLDRVVIAVDPAVSVTQGGQSEIISNETGIVVVGCADVHVANGKYVRHAYVLDDKSGHMTPDTWARLVVRLYHSRRADKIVAEVNNGGDLVVTNIHTVDPNVFVDTVHASRGKAVRAEPVAALYEQGRVHHVETFPELEQQMVEWTPGIKTKKSPDRMDALVWGLWELMLKSQVGEVSGPDPEITEQKLREEEALRALIGQEDEDDWWT
jgi:phage terminase large subunit-like protein